MHDKLPVSRDCPCIAHRGTGDPDELMFFVVVYRMTDHYGIR
jgi:hypothetical protein